MKKTMLVMAMVMAMAMSILAPALADHVDEPRNRFPALAASDCDEAHGTFTRVNGAETNGWIGTVRTCVVVTEEEDVETLQIGNSPRSFDSTVTREVTTTYTQYGNRGAGRTGVDLVAGFDRTTVVVKAVLSCTNPGEGDGIWLPGENNCPTS